MSKSEGLAQASEIYYDPARRVKELKAEGKRIIGYTCIYAPLEILTALDLFPYRLRGDIRESITEADKAFPVSSCPVVRNWFDLACKGRYDFLDGMVGVHSCDPQEKACHIWKTLISYPFFPYIDMPQTPHEWSWEQYKGNLKDFIKVSESFAGKRLSPERLRESIQLYNRRRALVRDLYELRKPDPPLISGTENIQVMVALESIPVEEGSELLEQVIGEVRERKDGPQKKPVRILLCGASIDDVAYSELIEGAGANLVMDDNCVGSRSYFQDVELTEDPLDGLVQHHLVGIRAPRTFVEAVVGEARKDRAADLETRFGYLGNHVKEWKANGVIFQLVRYCDPFGYELVDAKDYVDSLGTPNIYLEHDYTVGALAPLRTRVQAFVETVAPVL